MRKILILLSILFFISCSNDNDEQLVAVSNSNEKLLKKIQTYEGEWKDEWVFYYEGKKILYIDSYYYRWDFYYDDNKIVRYTQTEKMSNEVRNDYIYIYDNNSRLIECKWLNPLSQSGSKFIYEYLSNGTLKESSYTGDLLTQNNFQKNSILTFQNGNLINNREDVSVGDNSELGFEYNDLHNPMKNVIGMDKVFITCLDRLNRYFDFGTHYVYKTKYKTFNGTVLNQTGEKYNNAIEVIDNFPTEIKEIESNGFVSDHYKLIYY